MTADSSGVVFLGTSDPKVCAYPPVHLLNLSDGALSDKLPNADQVPLCEASAWPSRLLFKVCYRGTYWEWRSGRLQGLAQDNKSYFPLPFPEIAVEGCPFDGRRQCQIYDGYGAACLALNGGGRGLWFVPLSGEGEARRLGGDDVAGYALLADGKCVYSCGSLKDKLLNYPRQVMPAYYYDYTRNASCDLWQDFPVLSPVEKPTVWDRRLARVLVCVGNKEFPPGAFVQLIHGMMDQDSSPEWIGRQLPAPRSRSYLISDGSRFLLPLPDSTNGEVVLASMAGTIVCQHEQWDHKHKLIFLDMYDFSLPNHR